MKKNLLVVVISVISLVYSPQMFAAEIKEWTVLVFMNGHNSLDSFTESNINQMMEVGSSAQVNIVVQWASIQKGNTKRIYINKGKIDVIEDLAPVDMGDYHQLIEFARWAHERYPAKKYMVDVWNHGTGWHIANKPSSGGSDFHMTDISQDDTTGHKITTEQLGLAMKEIASIIKNKVELYASDACLMAMAEVAAEMADSVSYFAGSQESEPGDGWPYAKFLAQLIAKPDINGADLGKILSHEYRLAYNDGFMRAQEVTFSVYDLSKMETFNNSVKEVTDKLKQLAPSDLRSAFNAISRAQGYDTEDYKDLADYIAIVTDELGPSKGIPLNSVRKAYSEFVIANDVTAGYSHSNGVSVWLPKDPNTYGQFSSRYSGLIFHKKTGWGDFLNLVMK